ncbi:MAG: GTP cyclohydrolase II [Gammaproteobacteria bacterium]|nr:GTP cyclohydrolase II [Gammaproteobacteria bacterium]
MPQGVHAINILGPIPLPLRLGDLETKVDWYACVRSTELGKVEDLAQELRERGGQGLFSLLASSIAVNSVLVCGDLPQEHSPLIRVHSSCLTGDVFGSQRCECGPQLSAALERISSDPVGGMLVYMAGHEGRGIGLWAKAATYLLQDAGEDTYQANQSLGLPDDSRDFTDAGALIRYFVGKRPIRLLTNNPKRCAISVPWGSTTSRR